MFRKIFVFLAVAVFTTLAAFSQTKSFTNDDVLQMTKAGFDEQTIVKAIQTHEPAYDTSINALVALENAGVRNSVIEAMLTASSPKPEPKSSTNVDPNMPDEVGVYAMLKSKLVEVEPEIVGWRTGGMGKAMIGFSHGHVNGQVRNKESKLRLTTPVEIIIRCPEGTAVTEYQLLRLDRKGDRREFRAMTGGVIHSSGGAEKNAIAFDSTKIAPHTYRITMADPKRGEYGFLPPGSMSGNIASSGKIYTFGVIE